MATRKSGDKMTALGDSLKREKGTGVISLTVKVPERTLTPCHDAPVRSRAVTSITY
jgi:hypothetical protein